MKSVCYGLWLTTLRWYFSPFFRKTCLFCRVVFFKVAWRWFQVWAVVWQRVFIRVFVYVSMRVRVCQTYSSRPSLLNEPPPVPVQHECGITVRILRPVLCNSTAARLWEDVLTLTTLQYQTSVVWLVVAEMFSLCLCLTSLAGWLQFCLQLSPVLWNNKKRWHWFTWVIFYRNMIINIVIIIHSEVLHCCYYC